MEEEDYKRNGGCGKMEGGMRYLILILYFTFGCAFPSALERAFDGCEGRDGLFILDYSERTGKYKVTCRDMFEFKF